MMERVQLRIPASSSQLVPCCSWKEVHSENTYLRRDRLTGSHNTKSAGFKQTLDKRVKFHLLRGIL
ncbi:hypothetical protein Tsubulata_025641, partial [Turnera subulata]